MAENGTSNEGNATEQTFTQEQVNALIGERLKREREKFAGFEEYKAKAAKYDEAQEEAKSELQKATERAEKAEAELSALNAEKERYTLMQQVAKDTGLAFEQVSMLNGTTAEELTEQAKAFAGMRKAYGAAPDAGSAKAPANAGTTAEQFGAWLENVMNN